MKSQIRSILIILAGLFLAGKLIEGFKISFDWQAYGIIAGIIFISHSLVGPIIKALLIPFPLISHHLIDIFVISATLYGLTFFVPELSISAYQFPGLATRNFIIPSFFLNQLMVIIAVAVVITVCRFVLEWITD